jgi:hypothetical protein
MHRTSVGRNLVRRGRQEPARRGPVAAAPSRRQSPDFSMLVVSPAITCGATSASAAARAPAAMVLIIVVLLVSARKGNAGSIGQVASQVAGARRQPGERQATTCGSPRMGSRSHQSIFKATFTLRGALAARVTTGLLNRRLRRSRLRCRLRSWLRGCGRWWGRRRHSLRAGVKGVAHSRGHGA